MFARGMPSPSPASLDDDPDRDALLATLLDADRGETERIEAAWMLALSVRATASPDRLDVARVIGAVLREPTLWLGSEIVEVLRLLDDRRDIAFGVDAHGLVAVSPTPREELVAAGNARHARRMCPVLGDVVMLDEMPRLAARLAGSSREAAPWIALTMKQVVRGVDVELVRVDHPLDGPYTDWRNPPRLLPRVPASVDRERVQLAVPVGDAFHVSRAWREPAVARVVSLAPERLGVLEFATLRAVVVADGARDFDGWSIEPRAGIFAMRSET